MSDIAEAADLEAASFIRFLRHRLVFANSELLDLDIDRYYDRLPTSEGGAIRDQARLERAGLGVYLFCHYAERWGNARDADSRDRANVFLGDPHVRSLLFDLYEVDAAFRQDHLTLHEAGTTSFILKMGSNPVAYALKIIKPWYFDDDVISQQTHDYQKTYGYLASVIPGHFANIHTSNRYCIVMDFIEGITLRELFESAEFEAVSSPNIAPTENSLVSVMVNLCSLLSRCSSGHRPTFHGDLSTTNILVQPQSMKMFLIDFGTNYLLTRPVGTAEERSTVSNLVSDRHEARVAGGDHFRVGIILAEGLLGQGVVTERVPAIVDRIYERFPSIGPFMDTLFRQASQSQTTVGDGGTFTYLALSAELEEEFAALAQAEAVLAQRKLGIIDDVSLLVSPINLTQTFGFLRDVFTNVTRGGRRGAETSIQLKNLTWVPLLLNYFVIVAFFLTVVRHLNGALWPGIIAWTGSLTYSIIAARYCVFVFRDLDLSDWPGWPRRSVPIMCVLIWPAILTPLLIEWSWWAFCVASGTAIIAVNNQICIRSYESMLAVIDSPDRGLSRLMNRALEHLMNWRQLMTIFSAGVFILALLIWKDVVQDALFYGVIVAVAPALKMYLQQTGTEAPVVHAGLQRTVNAYRQAVNRRTMSASSAKRFQLMAPLARILDRVDSETGKS